MDPYKVLGVSPSATDDEIKTAYRNLVKKYHPDRYANAPKEVQDQVSEKVKQINAAYDEIKRIRSGGGASSSYGYGGSSYGGSSYGGYGGSSYGGYGYGRSSGSQGGGYASSEQFQDIREMISRGLILQAVSALDRIQNRTAEWYYLYGLCYMRQGMYSRARSSPGCPGTARPPSRCAASTSRRTSARSAATPTCSATSCSAWPA